jgi:hypothetical protein
MAAVRPSRALPTKTFGNQRQRAAASTTFGFANPNSAPNTITLNLFSLSENANPEYPTQSDVAKAPGRVYRVLCTAMRSSEPSDAATVPRRIQRGRERHSPPVQTVSLPWPARSYEGSYRRTALRVPSRTESLVWTARREEHRVFGRSHKAAFLNGDDNEYLAFKGESAQHGTPTFSRGLSEKQGTPGRRLHTAVLMRLQLKRENNRT